MPDFTHTIKADIYKIDPDRYVGTTEDTIATIINAHNSSPNVHQYEPLDLSADSQEIEGQRIQLYINRVEEKIPEWFDFVHEMASSEGREQLSELRRKYPSFLLFIYTDYTIYVVSKGGGRFVIANYILQSFGVEVLERLIDHSQSDLHSIQERGVIGSIAASEKHFKPNHKFNDEQSFGKFYKSVQALITKQVLEQRLGHEISRTSQIVGGENTLKISSNLTLEEIVERIIRVDTLLNEPNSNPINKFVKLNNKILNRQTNGVSLRESLENELVNIVYAEYTQGEVEVYHPAIFEYLRSESIRFKHEEESANIDLPSRITLNAILDLFLLQNLTQAQFSEELKKIEGALLSTESNRHVFREPLIRWLIGEVEFNNKKYFKFDGEWFLYRNEFITEINTRIVNLLNKIGTQESLLNWNIHDTEGEYNRSFRSQPSTIVCDKVLYKGIEICDFMKIESGVIKLYHVKNELGQSIRVVHNQIMNSAKFLAEIQTQSIPNNIIEDYYQKVVARHYENTPFNPPFTRTIFRNAIRKHKVTFVLVYGSNSRLDRDTQIKRTRSNIAKLSIIECENSLRGIFGFDFSIVKVQIQ